MDLALNNLQRLVCHKTQQTNQPTTTTTTNDHQVRENLKRNLPGKFVLATSVRYSNDSVKAQIFHIIGKNKSPYMYMDVIVSFKNMKTNWRP